MSDMDDLDDLEMSHMDDLGQRSGLLNIGYWIDNAHTNTFRDNHKADYVRKSSGFNIIEF